MKVFIVIDVNFRIMDDISIPCVFSSLDDAFMNALADVIGKDGKNIVVHNYPMENFDNSTDRVTNNNSLGSHYGVTYNSDYGYHPCARMIMEREVR